MRPTDTESLAAAVTEMNLLDGAESFVRPGAAPDDVTAPAPDADFPVRDRPIYLRPFSWLRAWWHDYCYDYNVHHRRYRWQCIRMGGGAKIMTPKLCRKEAIEYICGGGKAHLIYVDDTHKFIMFRDTV
jgi:hypothetical protein